MRSRRGAGLRCAVGLIVISIGAGSGCGGGSKSTGPSTDMKPSATTPADFDFGPNDARRATAFGDSITRGVVRDGALTSNNYPNNLQAMLRGQDPAWRVINRGVPGETTPVGARRFPGARAADRPGFALIMEGTNDAERGDDPAFILANLESMVSNAQANRTIPVLATIPPIFRSDPRGQAVVSAANTMIRTLARARGIVLAEIFDGMNDRTLFGDPGRDVDPLHPNERGYVLMAGIWFDAVQRALPAAALRRLARPAPAADPPAPGPGRRR
jgi:lysophospholipase L1-like esterase